MSTSTVEFPLFDELLPAARRILIERGVTRRYHSGQILWRSGTSATRVHFVLDGEVKLVRNAEDGRQHVVHRGRRGATLGDAPVFAGGKYPVTAIATRQTRCLTVDLATLELAMAADPALARHFLGNLARRVEFLVQRLDERSREAVRSRLLRYLKTRSDEARGGWFSLGQTQAELAEELGTVREVVVRALTELRHSGVLKIEGRRYRIENWAAISAALRPE